MPKYTIYLTNRAKKELDKLAESVAQPIFSAISKLEDNPRPLGYKNYEVDMDIESELGITV